MFLLRLNFFNLFLQLPGLIGAQDTCWTSWIFYLFPPTKPLPIFNKLHSSVLMMDGCINADSY